MFVRLKSPTANGKIMIGSGTSRLLNHKVPSVAMSGHNTLETAESESENKKRQIIRKSTVCGRKGFADAFHRFFRAWTSTFESDILFVSACTNFSVNFPIDGYPFSNE